MSSARRFLRQVLGKVHLHVTRTPPDTLGTYLSQLFQRFHIDCVLDVGAHFGEYGRFLRGIGFAGLIISVEPVEANFERLEREARGDGHWAVHHLALGATDGVSEINVTEGTDFTSFLTPTAYSTAEFPGSSRVVRRERVPVQRLDRFIGDCLGGAPSPSLYLKLDTQGYDLEVLRGAEGCLHRIVALQSEVSVKPIYEGQPSLTEALARLGTLGFEVGGLYPVTRDHAGRVVEFDCVALRTG
ncbi:MAG: FkbM family methyltransferase [Gemmatimonadales bacterium]